MAQQPLWRVVAQQVCMAAAVLDAVLEGPEILLLPDRRLVCLLLGSIGQGLHFHYSRKQFWSALPAAASR